MGFSPNSQVRAILHRASEVIYGLEGHTLDLIDIRKPPELDYAQLLIKIMSKLSPIIGNMIEYYVAGILNEVDWEGRGVWTRQDPGFPDAIFLGDLVPMPGFEVKAWFPLATEITARFRESVKHFEQEQTDVALIAWLPDNILYGKPCVLDVWIGSAHSLAVARDLHYHNPPDYLVIEPEDTSTRTSNLQQTNVNGYKFQGTARELAEAEQAMQEMGMGKEYLFAPEYQAMVRQLQSRYTYRLDTNFAKIDRIQHEGIEDFKSQVLAKTVHGRTVGDWSRLLSSGDTEAFALLDIHPQGSHVIK